MYQICCTKTYKAFSVKLSAFLFGAPRRCIKRWRFGLHGPGGSEHFQKQVAVRKSCGTRRCHGEAILIFLCGRTPPVIFGFALKSNILNTSFLSSRQSMRTSPFIFKACDAATQSSFILTSPLCCLLQAVRFVDTKSQVSFFSLPNFLFQRYFIADTVVFQGHRPYGRQAKSHSRAI